MERRKKHLIFQGAFIFYTEDFIKGRIYKIESKDNYVLDENGLSIRCSLRGKFKKLYSYKKDKLHTYDVAAVGDFIEFDQIDQSTGVITKVYERNNYLSRKSPRIKGATYRGERLEQIIAANVNNLFIVVSTKEPRFNSRVIDRILVAALSAKIEPHIVINKIDLETEDEFNYWKELYESAGCKVYLTSAKNNVGIENIREAVKNEISVFWGQSGVGKSSILNSMYPVLNFKVGNISLQTSKGTHTTVTSILKEVEENTFVIDTPGIREIEPYGIQKIDLGHYFHEFSEYINDCKFNTCTHFHEPGCAVVYAVETGEISLERYESYLNLLDTIEDDMIF